MKYFPVCLVFFILLAFASCGRHNDSERAATCADSFAVHYFNWQLKECLPFVTAESEPFLQFAASNMSQADVELLRSAERDASVEITNVFMQGDTAFATVTVGDCLEAGAVGEPLASCHGGQTELHLVKKDGEWKVDLSAGLVRTAFRQQNGMPGRAQDQDV